MEKYKFQQIWEAYNFLMNGRSCLKTEEAEDLSDTSIKTAGSVDESIDGSSSDDSLHDLGDVATMDLEDFFEEDLAQNVSNKAGMSVFQPIIDLPDTLKSEFAVEGSLETFEKKVHVELGASSKINKKRMDSKTSLIHTHNQFHTENKILDVNNTRVGSGLVSNLKISNSLDRRRSGRIARKCSKLVVRAIITGLDFYLQKKLSKIIQSLGGIVLGVRSASRYRNILHHVLYFCLSDMLPPSATHIICDRICRTEKFLCGVSCASFVVTQGLK